ncbi:MAG TPA: FAD-dependent oxidoreductase [Candidatus Eisenbergiella stercoravium]|nr:FAD-dependent oxidoreductase [Candidatus Eisenbergiella stercoravium]
MEKENHLYDVVVIGGGPAGLTAALYLARARYRVVVVEKEQFGGQITITSEVVNYPGVERTSGRELTENMRRQAQNFGAEFLLAEVTGLSVDGDIKQVQTSRGGLSCFGILLATGAHPRMVGFQGEREFRGRGVAYCATCDGEFFTGREVFVVGGGFAAAEESVFLTKYASHVTILIRGDGFTCAPAAAEAALQNEKITVFTHTQVEEVSGDDTLKILRYRNTETGEVTEYRPGDGESFGVFVFAGYEPATELVRGIAECDGQGYIVTDQNRKTSSEGLYAVGDVCIKPLRQVVTAVGDGALAATELERYAAAMQKKTGLHPKQPAAGKTGQNAGRTAAASSAEKTESGGTESSRAESGRMKADSGLFTADMLAQLDTVFSRMESSLQLELYLDDTPLSRELKAFMEELCALTDRLSVRENGARSEAAPCVRICREDGSWTGLAFHGVPGGHEFTSFVLGLYNAAGPGQTMDEESLEMAKKLGKTDLKVLVSLSCTMCPELVTAAQRIAVENPEVSARVYDLNHFPGLRERYRVMSVPCLVVNDGEKVSFGKKNVRQLLELLTEQNQQG